MSAQPWGRTGMVTLSASTTGNYHDVRFRRDLLGYADRDPDGRGWRATVWPGNSVAHDLPTLNAAVMWVLRRATPKVWREERGPVWQVKSCHGVRDRYGYRWRIYAPNGSEYTHSGATGTRDGWEWAMREIAYQLADPAREDAP